MAVGRRDDLGAAVRGAGVAGCSERELLDRFARHRDEAAFAAIVARHGPMVAGVCRGLLRHPADVDDAVQATFLVLVRRSGRLREPDRLGPWLFGVARRVAIRARAARAARNRREVEGILVESGADDPGLLGAERRELRARIDDEVDHLSPDERAAVVLCDLEGLTHREAADRLGWPLGTVKVRLGRGRERLRGRLERRGVALSAPALASVILADSASAAPLARALAPGVVRLGLAAAHGRAGAAFIPPSVHLLAQGVARTMVLGKLPITAVVVALASGAWLAPTLVARQGPAPPAGPNHASAPSSARDPDADPDPPPVAPAEDPRALRELASTIVAAYTKNPREEIFGPCEAQLRWFCRLADAEYAAAPDGPGRIAAIDRHVGRLRDLLRALRRLGEARDAPSGDSLSRDVDLTVAMLRGAVGWLQAARRDPKGWSPAPKAPPIAARVAPASATPAPPGPDDLDAPEPARRAEGRIRLESRPSDAAMHRAILAKLDERISMNFPDQTPFADVLRYIMLSTQHEAAGLPTGIPIYVDPRSMLDAGRTMGSLVTMKLEGVPLRSTLRLILDQLDLTYSVEGGVLLILTPKPVEAATTKPGSREAKPGGMGAAHR